MKLAPSGAGYSDCHAGFFRRKYQDDWKLFSFQGLQLNQESVELPANEQAKCLRDLRRHFCWDVDRKGIKSIENGEGVGPRKRGFFLRKNDFFFKRKDFFFALESFANPLEAFASPLEAFAYSLDVPAACLEGFSTGNIDRKPACKEQAFEKESLGQPA